jgi:hypothetical protein
MPASTPKPRSGDAEPPRNLPALDDRGGASRKTKSPEIQQQYSVTDGRTALGTIELIGGSDVAIDAPGQLIGMFATLKAAVASFGGRPR